MARPDLGNSDSRLSKADAPGGQIGADKWAALGRPLFWNGAVRVAFGGALVFFALAGMIFFFGYRANAAKVRLEQELTQKVKEADTEKFVKDAAVFGDGENPKKAVSVPNFQKATAKNAPGGAAGVAPELVSAGTDLCLQGPIALLALGIGLIYIIHGLKLVLQPVYVPADAPGGILGLRRDVLPILENLPKDDLYLGTYKIPTGLISLIVNAVAPNLSFFTPPLHPIAKAENWLTIWLITSLLTLCCTAQDGGWGLILIPGSVLAAIPVFGIALLLSGPRRPASPEVVQCSVTRVDVGNPMSLYEYLRHEGLDHVRSQSQKANPADRMRCRDSDSGKERAAIKFKWSICLEGEPVLVKGNAQFPLAASILEGAAAVSGVIGAVCALLLPLEQFWGLKLAGVVHLCLAIWFMKVAYTIRNTYRWKSDLFAVVAEGTMQRQRTGGEDTGFRIDRFISQIHLTVIGTRVISESTTAGVYKVPPEYVDERQASRNLGSALSSKRYLIETCVEDEFRATVDSIVQIVQQFRDREGIVMGAEEDSAGAQSLQENKKKRRQEELLLEQQAALQKQMQMMLFGKVLENMTPEQIQQMMLQGNASVNAYSLPVVIPAPEEKAKAPSTHQALPTAAIVPAPLQNQLLPDIEKQLKNAYREYYRTYLNASCDNANRAEKLEAIRSKVRQYKISRDQVQAIEKAVRAEMGIKSKT